MQTLKLGAATLTMLDGGANLRHPCCLMVAVPVSYGGFPRLESLVSGQKQQIRTIHGPSSAE